MANVQRPRFGVHTYFYGASDRTVWYATREAQDRAYWNHKREAERNVQKAENKRKRTDVKYCKKVERA